MDHTTAYVQMESRLWEPGTGCRAVIAETDRNCGRPAEYLFTSRDGQQRICADCARQVEAAIMAGTVRLPDMTLAKRGEVILTRIDRSSDELGTHRR